MMPDRITGVLCAGNISYDILVRPVDRFRWGTSTWVDEYIEDMGGNGSNTSYALAMLGVPVRLLGMVGPDDRGEYLLNKLRQAGVDASFVGRSAEPTTTTICVANSAGDRLFLQRVGSSKESFSEPTLFTAAMTAGLSHYHQANLYSLPNLRRNSERQMRNARRAGLTTSLDTGWATDGKWMEVLEPALAHTDLLFVNEDEAFELTSERDPDAIVSRLRRHGAGDVAVKLGAKGCVVYKGNERIAAPAVSVSAVDTTGAGDCFAAGFLAALYHGLPCQDAARVANAAGALAVTQLGAVRGVMSWVDTLAWMNSAR